VVDAVWKWSHTFHQRFTDAKDDKPFITMRLSSRFTITILAASLVIFGWTFRISLKKGAQDILDRLPGSEIYGVEHYNFIPSEVELFCFSSQITSKPPIPDIVHYVVGLEDPELSYPAYLSIRSTIQSLNPQILKIHHTSNINQANVYIQSLLRYPQVMMVQHEAEEYVHRIPSTHYAHWADILRLEVLLKDGGIYLDSDVFALKSFSALQTSQLDVVLGNEGGSRNGLCNAIILARPNATFIQRWLDSYDTFQPDEWNRHSVILPKKWANENPTEVCQLSPHVFFWPTWTNKHVRWMHEPLDQQQMLQTQKMLLEKGGSLFDKQLAYHAWNQASGSYLSKLDKETIFRQDTRFNMMVRRFA
jgi:glycosyl transferase-like sugar-binding protein